MLYKVNLIVDFILMFFLIISTNSILINIEDGYNFDMYIILLIFLSLLCKITLFDISRKVFNSILILLSSYYFVIILIFVINFSSTSIRNMTYYFIILPIIMVIIILLRDANQLKRWLINFVNITVILALVSLVFWVLGSNLKIISSTDYFINRWSDGGIAVSYYNIYFETQYIEVFGNIIIRNSGIFAEAPMWNLVLSLALIFQRTFLEKNKYKFFILVITIISTVSTTGIYIIGLIFLYKIIFEISLGWKKYITLALIPILILVLSIVWENKVDTSSADVRFDDYHAGIKAWLDNIFFGSGFSNGLKVIESYMDTTIRANLGYSNSIFVVLAQGGLILFILYFFPMMIILLNRKYSYNIRFFVLLIIVILGTTIFANTYIFALIVGLIYSIVFIGEIDEKNYRRI